MTLVKKQDSNSTGLRYCQEASLGVLPATADQVWYPAEPNSYSDFGGQIKTVARNPINASRQNQKGVTVDLDASGGWNSDLTKTNLLRLLRGFMFADMREPFDTQDAATNAVALGQADALSADSPVTLYAIQQTGDKLQPAGESFDVAPYGIAVGKDRDLTEAIQAAMQSLVDDGTYGEILDAWGVADGGIEEITINAAGQG